MRRITSTVALLAAAIGASAANAPARTAPQGGGTAVYGYRVVNTYPHDSRAFTQGLIYRDGFLYESTGLTGQSSLRKVKLETGEVVQKKDVESKYFAEGLTDWKDALVQLTWQTEVGFVYDLGTFGLRKSFTYTGQGWGLTHDATRLILSDGSPNLRFFDPATLKETKRITVKDGSTPIEQLNELEVVKGEVFANVWQTDRIARIDPATGRVTGWIDLTNINGPRDLTGSAVLNGIAYDAATDRLFVTGKLWPKLFEIKLERRQR